MKKLIFSLLLTLSLVLPAHAVTVSDCSFSNPGADRFLFWDDSAGDCGIATPGTGIDITGTTANVTLGDFSTSNLTEGSNLYFTDERAQDAVGAMAGSSLVYSDGTPLLARAALTGDITAEQDSNATTLATVNSNVGTFGSASNVGTFTVNGKGLVTAASSTAISIPSTQVSDFTEASQDAIGAMVNSTLTYTDGTPLLGINLGNANTWTARPTFQLTTEQLRLGYDASHYLSITQASTGHTSFALNNASYTFNFANDIAVGITGNPAVQFEVGKATGGQIAISNNGVAGSTASPLSPYLYFLGYNDTVRGAIFTEDRSTNVNGGWMRIQTADTSNVLQTRIAIDNAGLVGIGHDTPIRLIHAKSGTGTLPSIDGNTMAIFQQNQNTSTANGIAIVSGNAAVAYLNFGDTDTEAVGRIQYDHSTNMMQLRTSATPRIYINATGNGFLEAAPTHTITQGSTGTGYVHYNTSDLTNFERFRQGWSGNVYQIFTEVGGTGTVRSLQLGANGTANNLLINAQATSTGAFNFTSGSTSTSGTVAAKFNSANTASSGSFTAFAVTPTFNQTGSGGWIAGLINVIQGTSGSGTQTLFSTQLNSVEKFGVSGAGNGTFAGTLGVGGAATKTLDVFAAAPSARIGGSGTFSGLAPYLTFQGANANQYSMGYRDGTGYFVIGTGADITSAEQLVIARTTGNVGVGTTSPSAKLHALSVTEQLRLGYDASNYASFAVNSVSGLVLSPGVDSTRAFNVTKSGGSTSVLNVDTTNSRVGVLNNTPGTQLHVGAGNALAILDGAGAGFTPQIQSTTTSGVAGISATVYDGTDNRRVGLFVDNTNGIFGISSTYSSSAIPFVYRDASAERFRVATTGNFGIGTNSPDRLLHSEVADSGTNTVIYPLRLTHITSGTATTGLGVGQEFEAENASGTNRVVATFDFPFSDATNATEDTSFALNLIRAGTLSQALLIDSVGAATFNSNVTAGGSLVANGTSSIVFQGRGRIISDDANSIHIRNNGNSADGTLIAAGVTVSSGTTLITSTVAFTNGAGAASGTLTNAPTAGNPTKWMPINDNGTTRYIPAW